MQWRSKPVARDLIQCTRESYGVDARQFHALQNVPAVWIRLVFKGADSRALVRLSIGIVSAPATSMSERKTLSPWKNICVAYKTSIPADNTYQDVS